MADSAHDRTSTAVEPTDPEVAEQIIATIREWVRKDVIPVASDYEHADEFPTPLVEQMKAFGLFGAKVPVEYGGLGLDTVTYTRLM
ncbi:MAG: acyl-CoA dehydrogenase family protein, partial [Acidimicrobiales bacterium]